MQLKEKWVRKVLVHSQTQPPVSLWSSCLPPSLRRSVKLDVAPASFTSSVHLSLLVKSEFMKLNLRRSKKMCPTCGEAEISPHVEEFHISVLLRCTLFCRNLHAFALRKIKPKIAHVEKNDKYKVYLDCFVQLKKVKIHTSSC